MDLIKSNKFNDALNIKQNGYTPLYYAASRGELEIVEWFINHAKNLDVNDGANGNETPLHIAYRGGWIDIVQVLLAHPN